MEDSFLFRVFMNWKSENATYKWKSKGNGLEEKPR